MNSPGFPDISSNCDILIYIYKLLHFKDQLQLAQVCESLKSVFESFIWTVNYETLTVAETFPDYLVSNETRENRLLLQADCFREFLGLYAENVQNLTSYSHLDLRPFKNLTILRCCTEMCWLELIQSVAENLPHLERVHLLSFRQDQKMFFTPYIRIYMFGAMAQGFVTNEFIDSLLKMKHLKELSLNYRDDHPIIRIKYEHFCKLLNELPMEVLKLSFVVEPEDIEEGGGEFLQIAKALKLRDLQITTTFDLNKWSNNLSSFLDILKNLNSLNLRVTDGIVEDIFNSISRVCEHLQILTIQRTTFSNISEMQMPSRLQQFHLEYCYGLSYDNLKQILRSVTIKVFISHGTWYKGDFEDFAISSSIETLAVSGLDMNDFQSAYADNDNLKNLTWYPSVKENRNRLGYMLGKVPKNLKTLYMSRGQMALETLLQLEHLQSLTTWIVLPQQWFYILDVLKHPSLRELIIRIDDPQSDEAPTEACLTNVRRLKLFYRKSFALDLNFWLDLLSQNPDMSMAISANADYEDSLKMLIFHKKFPRFLKKIHLFGFTIKCNDLRNNFNATVKQIGYHKDEFDDPEDDKYFIVIGKN